MSAFNKHSAYQEAVAIVKEGLSSGSIKLHGAVTSSSKAQADAAYLNALINSLAANLTKQGE